MNMADLLIDDFSRDDEFSGYNLLFFAPQKNVSTQIYNFFGSSFLFFVILFRQAYDEGEGYELPSDRGSRRDVFSEDGDYEVTFFFWTHFFIVLLKFSFDSQHFFNFSAYDV